MIFFKEQYSSAKRPLKVKSPLTIKTICSTLKTQVITQSKLVSMTMVGLIMVLEKKALFNEKNINRNLV